MQRTFDAQRNSTTFSVRSKPRYVFDTNDSFIPEARSLEGVFKRLMLAGPTGG